MSKNADEASSHISVIIPTYNDAENVLVCLDALHHQTFPKEFTEIIVVDDGSSDSTGDRIQQAFPDVRLIRKHHSGPYDSRNAGIRAASGSILAFTDSDCLPDPDWLRRAAHDVQVRGYAVVGGRVLPSPAFFSKLISVTDFGQYLSTVEREVDRMPTLNLVIRRDLLIEHKFEPGLKGGADILLTWQLHLANHRILYDPQVIVTHHPRESLSSYFERKRRNARNFVYTRRIYPEMPGGWMLRFGPVGALAATVGRSVLDFRRIRSHWAFLSLRLTEIPVASVLVVAGRIYSLLGAVDGWMLKKSKGSMIPISSPDRWESKLRRSLSYYNDVRYVHRAANTAHVMHQGTIDKMTPYVRWNDCSRTLEVGCGAGVLRGRLPNWIGVDVSEAAVRRVPDRHPAVVAAAEALPFSESTFDLVVMFNLIEHLSEPQLALDEAVRLLRPGGYLIIRSPQLILGRERLRSWLMPFRVANELALRLRDELRYRIGRRVTLRLVERHPDFSRIGDDADATNFYNPHNVLFYLLSNHNLRQQNPTGPLRRVLLPILTSEKFLILLKEPRR